MSIRKHSGGPVSIFRKIKLGAMKKTAKTKFASSESTPDIEKKRYIFFNLQVPKTIIWKIFHRNSNGTSAKSEICKHIQWKKFEK